MADLDVGNIFPEMDANEVAGMSLRELTDAMGVMGAMRDAVNAQYRDRMAPLQEALDTKIKTEKAERDSDPEYKKLEQGVQPGKSPLKE